jgi:hypothetical protein
MAHIILYKDEYIDDVWKEYCDICGVHPSAVTLTIVFNENTDVKAEY